MMPEEYAPALEQSRMEKLNVLGILCYNLYTDGIFSFPEMYGLVDDIKTKMTYLMLLKQKNEALEVIQQQEEALMGRLTELGCFCYNYYIDGKFVNKDILSLCDSISTLSQRIRTARSVQKPVSDMQAPCGQPVQSAQPTSEHMSVSTSQENVPYGMEPIPIHYKQCVCGYRNKEEAWFCGKCGSKLS